MSKMISLSLGVFFVFITFQVEAQGEDEITAGDLEFLEFLGDWETKEGEWMDPLLFDDDSANLKDSIGMDNGSLVVDKSIENGTTGNDISTHGQMKHGERRKNDEQEKIK